MTPNAFTAAGTPSTSASASSRSPALPASVGQILVANVVVSSNANITTATAGGNKLTQVNGTAGHTTAIFWALAGSAAPTFTWAGAVACSASISSWTHPVATFISISLLNSFSSTSSPLTVGLTNSAASPGSVFCIVSGVGAAGTYGLSSGSPWNTQTSSNVSANSQSVTLRLGSRPASSFPSSTFTRSGLTSVLGFVIELVPSQVAALTNETNELELAIASTGLQTSDLELVIFPKGVQATDIELAIAPAGLQTTEIEIVPQYSSNKIDVNELEVSFDIRGTMFREIEIVVFVKPAPVNTGRGKFIWIG
jgi:hypothetical protein